MPLTTTGDLITSDRAPRTARLVSGRPPAWQVTWLPGRILALRSAVTAITLPAAAASGLRPSRRIWSHIGNRAAEPGQTTPQAITLATRSPEKPGDTKGGRPPARLRGSPP